MESRKGRRAVLAAGGTLLAGCSGLTGTRRLRTQLVGGAVEPTYDTGVDHDLRSWRGYEPDWAAPSTSLENDFAVETLVSGLEIPWDVAFAPNSDCFVTERTGRVLRYRDGTVSDLAEPPDAIDAGAVTASSRTRSWYVEGGEGGTMGVAVHPRYPDVPLVYVYYTASTADGPLNRLAYVDASASDPWRHRKTLLSVPAGTVHDGGRIAFGPRNYLWITTGDVGEGRLAQDPASLAGKVLRLTPDGAPAPGNPDIWPGTRPEVFSLGHRNPQGITWTPDGTPLVDEHGPARDEVQVVTAGGNYGWPVARARTEYAGTAFVRPVASSAVEVTTWAPSGSVFYAGDAVPALRNRLLVGCLREQKLKVFTFTRPGDALPPLGETGTRHDDDWLDDRFTVTSHDALLGALGRIRHVEQGHDDGLYAVTSNRDGRASGPFPRAGDDRLVRITVS